MQRKTFWEMEECLFLPFLWCKGSEHVCLLSCFITSSQASPGLVGSALSLSQAFGHKKCLEDCSKEILMNIHQGCLKLLYS